jgi:hypothetical protein
MKKLGVMLLATLLGLVALNVSGQVQVSRGINVGTANVADDSVTYAKIQNISAASRFLCRGSAAGSGDTQECTFGSGLSLSGTALSTTRKATFGFTIDNGADVITTGFKACTAPFADAQTITKWTILSVDAASPTSGSITLDFWKDSYTNFIPTVADTITAAAKPSVSATTKNQSSTLTGWTTAIAANDIVCVNVDSVTSLIKVLVSVDTTVP